MQTSPETPTMIHYMFRGLIRGLKGFNQVRIARTVEYQKKTLVHLIHVQKGSNTTKIILLQLGNNMGDSPFLLFLGFKG